MRVLMCEGIAETLAAVMTPVRLLLLNLWLWQQPSTAQQVPTPDTSPTPVPSPSPPLTPVDEEINWFVQFWNQYIDRKLTIGNFAVSLASLVVGALVLFAAFATSRWIRRFLEPRLSTRTHIDPGTQYTLLRLIHYTIVIVGVLVAARVAFAADFTSLAVLFTALSVGIGFGLQYLAGDLAAGFVLLFERSVRVGDFIVVEGPDSKLMEGRVQSINLRSTVVLTNDHIAAIVPNSKLVNNTMTNWSYRERRTRISVHVGVSYDSDVDLVTRKLLEAAEGVEYLLAEPKPSVQFLEFGDSSLNFRLLVWTGRPRRYPQIKSNINYRILRLFREAGIEIPFPQRDINVRGGSLKVESNRSSDGDGRVEQRHGEVV